MKSLPSLIICLLAGSLMAREYPVSGLKLTTDANADKHSITNLPDSFWERGSNVVALKSWVSNEVLKVTTNGITVESDPVAIPLISNEAVRAQSSEREIALAGSNYLDATWDYLDKNVIESLLYPTRISFDSIQGSSFQFGIRLYDGETNKLDDGYGFYTNYVTVLYPYGPIAEGQSCTRVRHDVTAAYQEWVQNFFATRDALNATAKYGSNTYSIVKTYLLSSNSWMTVSNSVLSLCKIDDVGKTSVVVWASSEVKAGIDASATNELWKAIASANSTIAGKADKAWGKYTPDGNVNPDPVFQTFVNTPSLSFASGCSWESCGSYSVLLTSGTVAYTSGTNGTFRIGKDSTNYFGYVTGDSVLVGAVPNSIKADKSEGTTNGFVTISYNYTTGNEFPIMWFTPTLDHIDWQKLDGVVWVDNTNGTATATCPATLSSGFYKATTTAKLGAVFVSTMPASLKGGVYGNVSASPVIFDSTITVKDINGVSYRIPAQRE